METVAEWRSKSGKYFVKLNRDSWGFSYRAYQSGGNLGNVPESAAIAAIERKLAQGLFQPDANTTPLRRIL